MQNYKWKAPLGNTGIFGKEVQNRGKTGVEGNNSGQYFSDLLPLKKIYRTDFILQRLRSISRKFYMDNLFTKQRYIIGNTCDQIFTDGEGLVYVHSMQYK